MTSPSMRFPVPTSTPLPATSQPRGLLRKAAAFSALALGLCLAMQPAFAATETVLYNFAGGTADGSNSYSDVVADSSGNLYGTTTSGGANNLGTVFRLTPPVGAGSWTESMLYSFGGALDGKDPWGGVFLDSSTGKLYGTTTYGGQGLNNGTFFEVTPGVTWTETGLFSFPGGNGGQSPYTLGNVIRDASGNFYATTAIGGTNAEGAVVQFSFSGPFVIETVIYSFARVNGHQDGVNPYGALVMDSSGNLYGTTLRGGASNYGTVFELSPPTSGSAWTETLIHQFTGATGDGANPQGRMIFDSSGNLLGMTPFGGLYNNGTAFKLAPPSGGGTAWTESVIHNFGATGTTDGYQPWSGLAIDSSGTLYGSTKYGGAFSNGTVFKLVSSGIGTWTETVLHDFHYGSGSVDGAFPIGDVHLDASGNLYGTTYQGGTHGVGLVYEITP